MQPKQMVETRRPVSPRVLYCMGEVPWPKARQWLGCGAAVAGCECALGQGSGGWSRRLGLLGPFHDEHGFIINDFVVPLRAKPVVLLDGTGHQGLGDVLGGFFP